MGISPKALLRASADDRRMGRNALQAVWLYHCYFAVAVAVTPLVVAGAHWLRLGKFAHGQDRAVAGRWRGHPCGCVRLAGIPERARLGGARRRMRYEWNMVRANLNLRQSAALMERLGSGRRAHRPRQPPGVFEKLDAEWHPRTSLWQPPGRDHAGCRCFGSRQRPLRP